MPKTSTTLDITKDDYSGARRYNPRNCVLANKLKKKFGARSACVTPSAVETPPDGGAPMPAPDGGMAVIKKGLRTYKLRLHPNAGAVMMGFDSGGAPTGKATFSGPVPEEAKPQAPVRKWWHKRPDAEPEPPKVAAPAPKLSAPVQEPAKPEAPAKPRFAGLRVPETEPPAVKVEPPAPAKPSVLTVQMPEAPAKPSAPKVQEPAKPSVLTVQPPCQPAPAKPAQPGRQWINDPGNEQVRRVLGYQWRDVPDGPKAPAVEPDRPPAVEPVRRVPGLGPAVARRPARRRRGR